MVLNTMNIIKRIITTEWVQWRRDKRLKWLTAFVLLISFVALWHQLDYQSNLLKIRSDAQQDSRKEWLSQELKHPHIAAHFGNYAYKKPSLLHCFDPGLSIYTGTSVYMEPHRQNDFLFSKSQESDTGLRFGWLSPALICQLLLPLLIIILSFNSINGEYEKGTMPLLISHGVSLRKIIIAKTLAVFIVFEILLTTYLLLAAVCSSVILKTAFDFPAFIYLWAVYTSYCFIWSASGVLVSSWIRNTGASISVLLLLWMFTNILMPRIAANIAENMYPLATNYQFKKQITEAVEKGLDGHDPQSNRAKKIEQELLAKYKVDSVQQLPFNFEGYIMQQAEEYSSKVYDKYFEDIFNSLEQQKRLQSFLGAVSPYISLRNISMAACNASLESEIDFQRQAENFRRSFVQDMNNDMQNNSAYGSFGTYKVAGNKYASIHDLSIESRPLRWSFPHIIIENLFLLGWMLFLTVLLLIPKKKYLDR